MIPLIEMFVQGNTDAMRQIARQYNLSADQTEQAMDALMPAFSEALKRNASHPADFMQFMQALANGEHANYFDNPAMALSRQGINEGNAILGHLFGSKEVSRAVAANAAQLSGISQNILKQMLPALASMILGGLSKQMNGLSHAGSQPATNPLGWLYEQMANAGKNAGYAPGSGGGQDNPFGPFGRMFEEMMGGGRGSPQQPANPWGQILEQMMRGGMGGAGSPRGGGAGSDNPFGKMFEEMLRGGMGGGMGGARPANERGGEEAPQAPQSEAPRKGGFDELFGEMFETGRKVQKDYQRGIESIFDQYLEGMKKY